MNAETLNSIHTRMGRMVNAMQEIMNLLDVADAESNGGSANPTPVAHQNTYKTSPPPPRQSYAGANGGQNRAAKCQSMPYAYKYPFEINKKYGLNDKLKAADFWFWGEKDGGDNAWHGPRAYTELEWLSKYLIKSPKVEGSAAQQAFGDDDIQF